MTPYSATARPIVLSLPSNRVPVAGFAAGVVLARLQGRGWKEAALCGAEAFAAWAIARELDPDRPASAAAAMALALAWQTTDRPEHVPTWLSLLTSGAALSSARVLSGTVGPAPTSAEAAILGVGGGVAGYAGATAAAFAPALALTLSAHEGGRSAANPAQAALALALALAGVATNTNTHASAQTRTRAKSMRAKSMRAKSMRASSRRAPALALAAATALALARPPRVTAPTDDGKGICVSRRVQLSRLLVAGVSGAVLAVQRPRDVQATVLALLCAAVR